MVTIANSYRWICSWLTLRTQRVVVDGEASDFVRILSGVSQGAVLGPLMFLLYINDISENLTSHHYSLSILSNNFNYNYCR